MSRLSTTTRQRARLDIMPSALKRPSHEFPDSRPLWLVRPGKVRTGRPAARMRKGDRPAARPTQLQHVGGPSSLPAGQTALTVQESQFPGSSDGLVAGGNREFAVERDHLRLDGVLGDESSAAISEYDRWISSSRSRRSPAAVRADAPGAAELRSLGAGPGACRPCRPDLPARPKFEHHDFPHERPGPADVSEAMWARMSSIRVWTAKWGCCTSARISAAERCKFAPRRRDIARCRATRACAAQTVASSSPA